MRDSTYRHVVQILRDYRHTDRYIQQREEELMHPYRESDNNVGGGRSSAISNPSERMAITIAEDRRLANLENNRRVVELCLNRTDSVTRDLVESMYINADMTTTRAAFEVHISDRHARRLHSQFVEDVANELGLMV